MVPRCFLIEPGEAALTAIAWRGHSDARARSMARLPLDLPLPATDVARTGDSVFIEEPASTSPATGPRSAGSG